MTVTISRLYDRYSDAQRAVAGLESAGVPQSDVSIVANNSDNWYGTDKEVDRDRDGVDDRAEGAATGGEKSVQASAVPQACWPAWVYWPFRASAPSWQPDGSRPRHSVR